MPDRQVTWFVATWLTTGWGWGGGGCVLWWVSRCVDISLLLFSLLLISSSSSSSSSHPVWDGFMFSVRFRRRRRRNDFCFSRQNRLSHILDIWDEERGDIRRRRAVDISIYRYHHQYHYHYLCNYLRNHYRNQQGLKLNVIPRSFYFALTFKIMEQKWPLQELILKPQSRYLVGLGSKTLLLDSIT